MTSVSDPTEHQQPGIGHERENARVTGFRQGCEGRLPACLHGLADPAELAQRPTLSDHRGQILAVVGQSLLLVQLRPGQSFPDQVGDASGVAERRAGVLLVAQGRLLEITFDEFQVPGIREHLGAFSRAAGIGGQHRIETLAPWRVDQKPIAAVLPCRRDEFLIWMSRVVLSQSPTMPGPVLPRRAAIPPTETGRILCLLSVSLARTASKPGLALPLLAGQSRDRGGVNRMVVDAHVIDHAIPVAVRHLRVGADRDGCVIRVDGSRGLL